MDDDIRDPLIHWPTPEGRVSYRLQGRTWVRTPPAGPDEDIDADPDLLEILDEWAVTRPKIKDSHLSHLTAQDNRGEEVQYYVWRKIPDTPPGEDGPPRRTYEFLVEKRRRNSFDQLVLVQSFTGLTRAGLLRCLKDELAFGVPAPATEVEF